MGKIAASLFVLTLTVIVLWFSSGIITAAGKGKGSPLGPAGSSPDKFVAGQILVKFQPGAGRAEQANVHRSLGGVVKREIVQIGVQVVSVPRGREEQKVKAYSKNPNVLFAEVDALREPLAHGDDPNDGGFHRKWDLHNDGTVQLLDSGGSVLDEATKDADINWLEAYKALDGVTLSSVVIAMVDTGADLNHPDLRIWVNEVEANGVDGEDDDENGFVDDVNGWDFQDNDNDPTDDDGHGTHTAGLPGAITNNGIIDIEDTAGVSFGSDTQLMILRVCGNNGCAISNLIDAYVYAADNGADVMNISIGGLFRSKAEDNAIKYAWNHGVVITASAGNLGGTLNASTWKNYPAAYKKVMAVASTDWHDDLAYYSSHGKWLSVAAPGGELFCGNSDCTRILKEAGSYSTTPTYVPTGADSTFDAFGWSTDRPYDYAQGTSMSSPVVAGLAALIRSVDPSLTNSEVRSIIENTADDLGAVGFDDIYGNGRVNAQAAVSAALPPGPPEPAVNGVLSTDKDTYTTVEASATLTAVVTDENSNSISELLSGAFATTLNGASEAVTFSETATTAGTYTGDLNISNLALGTHNMAVTVTDGRGVSGSDSTSFSIVDPSTSTDTVVITKATYSSRKSQLTVEATSTSTASPLATLQITQLDGGELEFPITMDYNAKKDKYSIKYTDDFSSKPGTVTVISSEGGSDISPVGGR